MDVDVIDTSSLGDRSYLISAGDTAVVIDPQRDIDRMLDAARCRGVHITHVLETHIHNDYVTGGLELSRSVGAEYVVPAGDDVDYERRPARDGDLINAGRMQLEVMHTPGHTHHHVSYVLRDATGGVVGVFTGGSMLHGTTGRTDLLGPQHTQELTHAQYRSVRRLAETLPDSTRVYPTHGFGSFCSATPATGDASTIAEQRTTNPALTHDEQAYVTELLEGLSAYPAYYAHMGVINQAGPAPVDLSLPEPVDPTELRRRIDAGHWVVDLRHRTAFAAGHLDGTLGFELSGTFVTYLGWLYQWGEPLTLIGDTVEQIADARRELVRIGIDDLHGAATGNVADLRAATELRRYRVADFTDLADILGNHDEVVVLDVRQRQEFAASRIPGAVNIPLHELPDRIDELPDGQVWVHCASGYRSSIAASLLDRASRSVVLIDDDYSTADRLHLTTT
ncbi:MULTISPECIES: MBL fold metallo-hydrolase [Mycolicibacterium]|uniref:MBL fold metallo-hydrolase n=1 Tax=Mycolicibacterium doricum TaxID=126673 RepID=A0A1X1T6L3_9MYCO|nr:MULTISPECIES: MBL fold metallo-hydrolase [Mycolicibacterium]MCV7267435.1 MBL fold metallo-hydrolase [Mycolicibacterium doricum]OBB77681.1 MBL fold metallo-hydrolase [Mycolicibacterium monacense]ORV40170.1 MBL fold metallo-hydrolase [Mycolicibacterium doricum]